MHLLGLKCRFQKTVDSFDGEGGYEICPPEEGVFLGFGIAYEDFENGVGQFTTCIVKDKDNFIVQVKDIETVQFIDDN